MAETLSSLQDLKTVGATPAPDAPVYVQKLDAQGRAYATGKRKDAVARVWIKPGSGKIVVNARTFETYFARPDSRYDDGRPSARVCGRSGPPGRH